MNSALIILGVLFISSNLCLIGYRFAKNKEWGVLTIGSTILSSISLVIGVALLGFTWQMLVFWACTRFFLAIDTQLAMGFAAKHAVPYTNFYVAEKKDEDWRGKQR